MINVNEQLTQHDAKWILEEVVPKAGYRIDHTTLGYWMKAHNLAFKEQVGIPGCSCEYIQTMKVWQSRIDQYKQHIENIAYPVVKTLINEENIVVEAITEIQTLPNEIRVKTSTGTKGKLTGKKSNTGKSNKIPTSSSGLTD
jgi:hypothetical protein